MAPQVADIEDRMRNFQVDMVILQTGLVNCSGHIAYESHELTSTNAKDVIADYSTKYVR